jgi:pilin isopeptide linkage protein
MKKMKKFLTALLATATIFSMSAMPTFAEETTPAQDLSKLTITKVLSMEEDGVIPDTTFSFTMTPLTEGAYKNAEGKTILGETTEKLDIYPGVALTKDSVDISFHNGDTLTKVEKTVDDQKVVSYEVSKTETFDLSVLKGEDMGVYRYVVEETIPEKNNGTINYDTTKYIVDVTIDKDGEIAYVISTNQTKNEKMPIEFKNSVASDKLIVKKLVTGQMGDKTKQFDFILNIPVAGDALNLRSATTIEGSIVRQNGTPDPVTITVGQDFAFT